MSDELPEDLLEAIVREHQLAGLLAELAQHRDSHAHLGARYDRLRRLAGPLALVPSVHVLSKAEALDAIVGAGALVAAGLRGGAAKRPEEYLGIGHVVYLSGGVPYPDPKVALLYPPTCEHEHVTATPWDTGAFCKDSVSHLASAAESVERREAFERHCLSAPHWRAYLVDYVATCFERPEAYLDPACWAEPSHAADPLGVICGHKPASRSFEVRFPQRLALDPVCAVFYLRSAVRTFAGTKVPTWLKSVEARGTPVVEVDGTSHLLQTAVRNWVRAALPPAPAEART